MSGFLRKLFGQQQTPQTSDEDSDLEKFYTDAKRARQVFEQLATSTSLPKRILVIHGLGGVGKSTLLKMYVLTCRKYHIPAALVASEEARSPVDALAAWEADLNHDGITLPTFQKTLNHYRAIQAKVEAEAKKGHQTVSQIAGTMVKTTAKTAITMATSAIPFFGPLVGAVGGEVAEAFIGWLSDFLKDPNDIALYLDPAKRLDSDFLNDLTRAAVRQRIVLMTDAYERMTELDDWMRELARKLPKNVLLVIAGRNVPAWDRSWQDWMGKAQIVELKEMTPDDIHTLVHCYFALIHGGDPDPKQVEAIVQFARGLPMVATTVVQLWVKYGLEDFQAVRPQVVADLVDRLLEGVQPDMHPAFESAAVLRYFNVEALSALLESSSAEMLYAELRRWPFIRSRKEGLAVHDMMREMMNEALKERAPDRFRTLHEQAAAYYEVQMAKTIGDERNRYGLERLYHRVLAAEEEGIDEFIQMAEGLVNYQLPSQLRVLLNDVNSYPLQKENNRLWREYYRARLMDLEGRQIDAVPIYQAIADNRQAEDILRAYALCDWAWFAGRVDIELKERILNRIHILFPEPDALPEPDAKLGIYLLEMGSLYKKQARWNDALMSFERALRLFEHMGDLYWLAFTYNRIKYYYLDQGMWKEGLKMQEQGMQEIVKLTGEGQQSYLEAELLGGVSIGWMWAGRYHETEQKLRKALSIAERYERVQQRIYFLRDLAFVLGLQGRMQEATQHFNEAIEIGRQQDPLFEAITQGFQGIVALKWIGVAEAETFLLSCINGLKQQTKRTSDIPTFLNWLGLLYEIKGSSELAEQAYHQCMNQYQFRQWYWHAATLTGLVRIDYVKGKFDSLASMLQDAETLAQQYEYNDHFTSLYLTRGHITWDGLIQEWESGFDAALHYYQLALIHGLRYNRFLLDEALAGSEQGTPLQPIIQHCLERGEEGQKMLVALRDWWQNEKNDIGMRRPDTISPIPEGIPIIEAERIARQGEPGDRTLQRSVVEQVNLSLQ